MLNKELLEITLIQCFSSFFGSRHPSGLIKNGGTPTWLKITICGTLCCITSLKRQKFQILWHPWHLLAVGNPLDCFHFHRIMQTNKSFPRYNNILEKNWHTIPKLPFKKATAGRTNASGGPYADRVTETPANSTTAAIILFEQ